MGLKVSAVIKILSCVVTASVLVGCSAISSLGTNKTPQKWLNSGSLVISRAVPKTNLARINSKSPMLGIMPSKQLTPSNYFIEIEKESGSISVFQGNLKLKEFNIKDLGDIEVGDYQVIHKQRNPVWYANDEYYMRRGLDVPPAHSQVRYLKGALGDFVIYLDEDSAVHNAPIWSAEVGGVRISEKEIAKLYNQLEIGSLIRVR